MPARSPNTTLTQPLSAHPEGIWQKIQKYLDPYHRTTMQPHSPGCKTTQFSGKVNKTHLPAPSKGHEWTCYISFVWRCCMCCYSALSTLARLLSFFRGSLFSFSRHCISSLSLIGGIRHCSFPYTAGVGTRTGGYCFPQQTGAALKGVLGPDWTK